MALSDRDIIITPNRGAATEPNIVFRGADASSSASITLRVINSGTVGTLSFEGTSGQLLSITDSMSGSIFSVNDISGIPSVEVMDTGEIKLAEYGGFVNIKGTTNSSSTTTGVLQVAGGVGIGGNLYVGGSINATSISGSAGSTIAALTMNNSGSGVASGTTFDGSTARTLSYNTLGASPLAGSSSLVTVGTITSGNWNAGYVVSSSYISASTYVNGAYLGVTNTTGSNGYGLSLYGGASAGQPTYGIMFQQTASFGTHGNVTADWATYFTMNNTANRGWVFRDVTNGNKASISNLGDLSLSRSLGVGTAGSGTAGEIRATNEITAYYSDRRLKTDVRPITNAVDKVMALNGIIYKSNDIAAKYGFTGDKDIVGLFADEVEAVLPEAVRPAPFDLDENNESISGENYKTIQYEKVVPLLVEAVKEQQQTINQILAKLEKLVNK